MYKVGNCEYIMDKAFADSILKTRKGEEKNMRPQDYLLQYVNATFGLKEHCSKVSVI